MAADPTLEQIIGFLLDAPMFGDLDPTELAQVVHILQVRELAPHAVLFTEGDPGDAWYVVYEGEVEIRKGATVISRLSPRACFGEMAILDGSPRSAAVSNGPKRSVLLQFPRLAFTDLLAADNIAAYKLVHKIALVLVARQRQTTAALARMLERAGDETLERIGSLVVVSSTAE